MTTTIDLLVRVIDRVLDTDLAHSATRTPLLATLRHLATLRQATEEVTV